MEAQITTYQELQDAVSAYLIRTDLVTETKAWIALWEKELNGLIRARKQERYSGSTTTPNDEFHSIPSDFLEAKLFKIGTTILEPMTLQGQTEKYLTSAPGKPLSFCPVGGGVRLQPTPDNQYVIDMFYVAGIPPLSDTSPTNWLLQDYPFLYLYGTLLQAQPYVKNPEEVSLWQNLIQMSIATINKQEARAKYATPGASVQYRGVVV